MLKSQTNKQIDLEDFPMQYEKIIGRTWDPCHYGLCELEDLLSSIAQSTIVIETREDGHTWVSIPKREQTPEEIELTKKFAQEVKYFSKFFFFNYSLILKNYFLFCFLGSRAA